MFSRIAPALLLVATTFAPTAIAAPARSSTVVTRYLESRELAENRVGLQLRRSLKVYLPPGYDQTDARYPVIYLLHSIGWSNEKMFAPGNAVQPTFDRAIADGVIRPFIAVAPDYTSPAAGSFFVNSTSAGRWENFTLREVIPFVDSNYRTLARADSRAITGDMMGAYGALLYAFHHPDVFSVVYAMHPVGTGTGLVPMYSRPDWNKVFAAQSLAELSGDPFTPVFVAMSQAFLPNANRPPFYCDFMFELKDGRPQLDVENSRLLRRRFLLDGVVEENLASVKLLRGIKFDWGRYDPNQDHVYANQAFTRKLDELGVAHEAEEFRGLPWDRYWEEGGRVYGEVLPFFARRLDFSPTARNRAP